MPFYVGSVLLLARRSTAPWWSRSRAHWGSPCGAAVSVLPLRARPGRRRYDAPPVRRSRSNSRGGSSPRRRARRAGGGHRVRARCGGTRRGGRRGWPSSRSRCSSIADAAPYTGAAGWVAAVPRDHALGPESERAIRPVRSTSPARRAQAVPADTGMMRVGDLYLPPDTTETPVELGWIAYVEWTTPAFYRGLLERRGPRRTSARRALRWFFLPDARAADRRSPAKPYATLSGRRRGIRCRSVHARAGADRAPAPRAGGRRHARSCASRPSPAGGRTWTAVRSRSRRGPARLHVARASRRRSHDVRRVSR